MRGTRSTSATTLLYHIIQHETRPCPINCWERQSFAIAKDNRVSIGHRRQRIRGALADRGLCARLRESFRRGGERQGNLPALSRPTLYYDATRPLHYLPVTHTPNHQPSRYTPLPHSEGRILHGPTPTLGPRH